MAHEINFRYFKVTFNRKWQICIEWTMIAMWCLFICRAYLKMNPNLWPTGGREYIMSIQNQYMWTLFLKCGPCFFWNGFTNGGAPSFIDTHGFSLHPVSIVTAILFGAFNSGKVIIIISFFMAGIGQWWLGNLFKLGAITRIWTSFLIIASGALAGRMQVASVPLVLSTASCILVIAAVLQLILHPDVKAAIMLGIILGLAMLSGQGYLQIGLLFILPPMILTFVLQINENGTLRIKAEWRYFLLAIMLALLIASPLLIPLIHFLPNFNKYLDPGFASAQPLQFNVLNLVIDNFSFYTIPILGKEMYGYLYINYIGWIPVIFAILGLTLAPPESKRTLLGLSVAIVFTYLTSSAVIFQWINALPYGDFISGIRNPGPVEGLAVPLILVLAGMGVDELIKKRWLWSGLRLLKVDEKRNASISLKVKWFFILLAMLYTLQLNVVFMQNWLYVAWLVDTDTSVLIKSLKTPDAQWVQTPKGRFNWLPAAIENGMKIRDFFRPWYVTVPGGEALPPAYLQMSEIAGDANSPDYTETIGGYVILKRPNNLYASIHVGEIINACKATSIGGFIDVACDADLSGKLIVLENPLNGWTVTRDGQNIPLLPDGWLMVDAPAGKHNYAFRYQPWDAPIGIILAMIGWVGAVCVLFYQKQKRWSVV